MPSSRFQDLFRLALLDGVRVLHDPLDRLLGEVGRSHDQVLDEGPEPENLGQDGRIGSMLLHPSRPLQVKQKRLSHPLGARLTGEVGGGFNGFIKRYLLVQFCVKK